MPNFFCIYSNSKLRKSKDLLEEKSVIFFIFRICRFNCRRRRRSFAEAENGPETGLTAAELKAARLPRRKKKDRRGGGLGAEISYERRLVGAVYALFELAAFGEIQQIVDIGRIRDETDLAGLHIDIAGIAAVAVSDN